MTDYEKVAVEDGVDAMIRLVAGLIAQRTRQEPAGILPCGPFEPDPPHWAMRRARLRGTVVLPRGRICRGAEVNKYIDLHSC